METKINIATILKNKPKGTKLYSTVHGKCTFEAITDEIFKINFCTSKFGLMQAGECTLIKFGNMFDDGECCKGYKRDFHTEGECSSLHICCSPEYYTTLEQLDFSYDDSSCNQELYGIVYCIDKETKQPVWLTRWCDDIGSGWVVNRIPEFYKNKKYNGN